jgi:hypothetical protein
MRIQLFSIVGHLSRMYRCGASGYRAQRSTGGDNKTTDPLMFLTIFRDGPEGATTLIPRIRVILQIRAT